MLIKISESHNSPPSEESIALSPNRRPLSRTFILLIIRALIFEPTMNASSDAIVTFGTEPNTVLNALSPSQNGAPGSTLTRADARAKKMLIIKPILITVLALRYP